MLWSCGDSLRQKSFLQWNGMEITRRVYEFYSAQYGVLCFCLRCENLLCDQEWVNLVKCLDDFHTARFRVLNFAHHLPKPWTDRFAHVNRELKPNNDGDGYGYKNITQNWSEFALLQTLSRFFHLVHLVKCWQMFLELNSKGVYQSWGKEKKVVVLCSRPRQNVNLGSFTL